jgi:hypothetical protein
MKTILNKRNAVLGWVAWLVGKRVAKRKLRQTKAARWLAIGGAAVSITALAVAAGAVFGRRHSHPELRES